MLAHLLRNETRSHCDIDAELTQMVAGYKQNRRDGWKKWQQEYLVKRPGRIFAYCKRTAPEPGPGDLHWGEERVPPSMTERMERAKNEWTQYWETDADCPQLPVQPPPRITLQQFDNTVRRMSDNKAKGADGWRPSEIAALPMKAKQQLIDYYHHAEQAGYWGPHMQHVLIALIPKPGATHEGQLRPIGILPMLYRVTVKL